MIKITYLVYRKYIWYLSKKGTKNKVVQQSLRSLEKASLV
ncbi:hypothetical protein HMPREF9378_1488 [Streptococcus sanguinis SK1 = NCTC 7863]|uniref:Uncharacterized protein n=3 Tax=Streptococcus sanguinis TaxID=1305 RepID=F0ISG7_STRSA|nr:hypothetical protein HMPREF9390_1494 [Streptococcus sanguinis SK405]EGD39294.1 hypothetical protein HMPREF9384_0779 [Streptococcus sanguinis SK160]EGF07067.1 hypothetical protein HMPREF9378_1488 [Streptococcus sanguinis SK1 = NCTC 7863]EGF17884.1 hypothetical protein HMPREF9391_2004 [Streptococcus sanguinis SK408]